MADLDWTVQISNYIMKNVMRLYPSLWKSENYFKWTQCKIFGYNIAMKNKNHSILSKIIHYIFIYLFILLLCTYTTVTFYYLVYVKCHITAKVGGYKLKLK